MKTLYTFVLALCLTAGATFGQLNTITQTTTSAAALATDNIIYLTSVTGVNVPSPGAVNPSGSQLYVILPGNPRGESMLVQSVTGTAVAVARGRSGVRAGIPSGAVVLIGYPNWFRGFDPGGSCVVSTTYVAPWINTKSGAQWLCSSITGSWVPSWGNPSGDAFTVTAAVASAAGLILPSGPLFHVTGALAITGFTIPTGFAGGTFTIIPDGTFTTTTATNIALASTAVVNKPLTFTYDATNSKFVPSY